MVESYNVDFDDEEKEPTETDHQNRRQLQVGIGQTQTGQVKGANAAVNTRIGLFKNTTTIRDPATVPRQTFAQPKNGFQDLEKTMHEAITEDGDYHDDTGARKSVAKATFPDLKEHRLRHPRVS